MISIKFGTVAAVKAPRLDVRLYGFEDDAVFSGLLLVTPGGQTPTSSTWVAPAVGDVVAVLVDDETPENSIVLGGVYRDTDDPGGGSGDQVAHAKKIYADVSDSVSIKSPMTKIGSVADPKNFAARADYVEDQLKAIEDALSDFITEFNFHRHLVGDAPGITTAPTSTLESEYEAGSVAASSVKIE